MTPSHAPSPAPWRVSDGHGLCVVDANDRIVADLTPRNDWAYPPPPRETLRANADAIIAAVNEDREATLRGIVKRLHDGWEFLLAEGVWEVANAAAAADEPMTPAEVLLLQEVLGS